MTNIINIDGISYELSDNYLDVSNIENFVISQDNIITDTYTVNKMEFYKFVSVSGNSNLKYIQDSKNNNVAIYNTQTNEIISVGEDNRINLNDCMQLSQQSGLYNYYNLQENNILDTSDIDSILIQDNNIIIDNETYNLIPIAEGGYFIRDTNGNNVAIYRPSSQEIISAGQNNSIPLAQVSDNNYYPLTGTPLNTSNINSVVLDLDEEPKTIAININLGNNATGIKEYNLIALDPNNENSIYAIEDNTGKTIALYDSNTNQIISAGENNYIYLTQATNGTCYPLIDTPLDTSIINYITLNIEGEEKTININVNTEAGTQNLECTLEELYTDSNGNIVYAIKDNIGQTIAVYDSNTNQIISAGENDSINLVQAPNNNYYPLTGVSIITSNTDPDILNLTLAPLETSSINSVVLDTQNQTININVNTEIGTLNLQCNLTALYTDDEGNIVYAIQDNTGKTIALYDSNTNQIISSGQDNCVDLDESFAMSNNQYFKLTGTPLETSNINSVALDTQNQTINLNITNGDTTENLQCTLTELYTDSEGNIVYAIKDNEQNIIALYDSNTNKIISSGQDNSINLNNDFTLYNSQYINFSNTPLATSNINSIYIDSTNNEIIINGTQQYDIEQMKDASGQNIDMWAIKDSSGNIIAVYDNLGNSPTIFAGQNNSVNLNNFTIYDGRYINISADNALSTSSINSVALDTQNQTININVNTETGTQNLQCTLTELYTDSEGNIVYAIKDNEQNIIALYDSNTNQIVSVGENNSIYLAQASNNNYYPLTGTPINTSNINSIALNLEGENKTINLNITNGNTTENLQCTLEELYIDSEGNIVYAIKDSTGKTIALYDSNTNQIISAGENNSANFALNSNGEYVNLSALDITSVSYNGSKILINDYEFNFDYSSNGDYYIIGGSEFMQFNPFTGELKISDTQSFNIASVNDKQYLLSSNSLQDLSNVESFYIQFYGNSGIPAGLKINDIFYTSFKQAEDNIFYIKDNQNNIVALYDEQNKTIISSGQNNSIEINNYTKTIGNDYVDLSSLDVEAVKWTNSTISINEYTFELTSYNATTGCYKINGANGSSFNPNTGELKLSNNGPLYNIEDDFIPHSLYDNQYLNPEQVDIMGVRQTLDSKREYIIQIMTGSSVEVGSEFNNVLWSAHTITSDNGIYEAMPDIILNTNTKTFTINGEVFAYTSMNPGITNFGNLYFLSEDYRLYEDDIKDVLINGDDSIIINGKEYSLKPYSTANQGCKYIQDEFGRNVAVYESTNQGNNIVIIESDGTRKDIDLDSNFININNEKYLSDVSAIKSLSYDLNNNKIVLNDYELNISGPDSQGKYIINNNNWIFDPENKSLTINGETIDYSDFSQTIDGEFIDITKLDIYGVSYKLSNSTKTIKINDYEFNLENIGGNDYKIGGAVGSVFNTNNKTITINNDFTHNFSNYNGDVYNNGCYFDIKSLPFETIKEENGILVIDGYSVVVNPVTDNQGLKIDGLYTYGKYDFQSDFSIEFDLNQGKIEFSDRGSYLFAVNDDSKIYALDSSITVSNIENVTIIDNNKIIIDGVEYKLSDIYGDDNVKYIQNDKGEDVAIFDIANQKIFSAGSSNNINCVEVLNNHFCCIDSNLSTSAISNVIVGNDSFVIDGKSYTLENFAESNGNLCYIVDDNNIKVGIYDKATNQIISSGQDNSINLNDSFTLYNGQYINFSNNALNTSDIEYVNVDINNKNIYIDSSEYNLEQMKNANGDNIDMWVVKDSSGNIIAVYNSETNQIISSGESNSIHLAQAPDNNYYPLTGEPLDTSSINSIALDTQNQTINLNITNGDTTENIPCTLTELYTDENTGNVVYAIKDNTGKTIALYDSNTNKIISSGQDNSISLDNFLASDNYYINLSQFDDSYKLNTSNINNVVLNINDEKIIIDNSRYNLIPFESGSHVYIIRNPSNSAFVGLYNSETNQIVSVGENNSIYLAQASNNNYYPLTSEPLDTSSINSVALNLEGENKTINLNITNGDTTENIPCTLTELYTDENTGNTIYAIEDNAGKTIALYDSNTNQIISLGQDNSINLNNDFTLYNGQYINFSTSPLDTSNINGIYIDFTENEININNILYNLEQMKDANGDNIDMWAVKDSSGNIIAVYDNSGNSPTIFAGQDNSISLDNFLASDNYYINLSQFDDSYKLNTSNINNVVLNINDEKIIIDNSRYNLIPFESGSHVYIIRNPSNSAFVGLYNSKTNQIVSTGENNSVDLDDFISQDNGIYNKPEISELSRPQPNLSFAVVRPQAPSSFVVANQISANGHNSTTLEESNNNQNNLQNSSSQTNSEGDNSFDDIKSATYSIMNKETVITDENKKIFNTIFENNEELSNYIKNGDYEGLKEALKDTLKETIGKDNSELLEKTQKVVDDMELDGVKTKEEFLGALNKSLDDNGFDTVEDIKVFPSIDDILTNPAIIATYSVASIILAALIRMLLKQILQKQQEEEQEKNQSFDINSKSNKGKSYENNIVEKNASDKKSKHTVSSPDDLNNINYNKQGKSK